MNPFIDLLSSPLKKEVQLRQAPPVPDTGWIKPGYFPDLSNADVIAFDVETKETDFDHGPGWGRNEGHIVGVSVAAIRGNERGKWYFPVRHEIEKNDNLAPEQVFAWLNVTLSTPNIPKVGANLIYDCGWLATEGIYPLGPLYDIQFAEALIDEEGRTALDFLGHKYLHKGKTADVCKDWIMRTYPEANETTWRGYLWRTPPRLVGPYAEDDADLPLDILWAQWSIMEAEGTLDLFKMECRSIPMVVKMRLPGIAVSITRAEQLREQLEQETKELYSGLRHMTATTIDNVTAPTQLAKVFDAAGLQYNKTPTGKPSFKKEWLAGLEHPVGKLINDIREREKLRDTFLDSYILDRAVRDSGNGRRGRIYCSFHPLRDDDGGAKTGRYSSSHPNLQNIPARTKLGKAIRTAFIPDEYHCGWHKKDHSQIEYRVFAHFAVGFRSDEIRQRYCDDPTTDYHDDTMKDVAAIRGLRLDGLTTEEKALFRKPIKNVNFGLLYGQTEPSLAYKAGWSDAEAKEFFSQYHAARPFVKTTMKSIENEVQSQGYITTILGRRTRFNRWEALRYGDRSGSYTQDIAMRKHGAAIRRAFAYRGVNYRFQGSAADILKAGMLSCYEQGVFDYIGMPKLQVHDELDWSKINGSPAMNDAFAYAAHVLETAVQLRVPLKVDSGDGPNWGAIE